MELRLEPARLASGLHVVATPIGNLGDVTLRALATLAGADAILAEDTRMTKRLLMRYGVTTSLEPYHEHNAERVRPALIARLGQGARIAIVSDAGTPLISDPGFKLVEAALAAGIMVTGAPGPSAVLAALMVAGLPTDRFFFEGFLPQKQAARRARLTEMAAIPGTLVIFESPRRLAGMLADAAAVLGERQAAVTRELTKLYEEVRRGTLSELAQAYAREDTPKGEIVVLIGTAGDQAARKPAADSLDELIAQALQGHSLKEAVARVAADTGLPRRQVYARALELSHRT
ncbi:16S rRNA (cytidine1402-2'-O)-methyltransferase [Rhizobiales bacterium GAS113]|nr:16S rRNA (cytidine1402-2'-O)-methyltransferase [Rhizobiales bacterium GAS113]